MTISFPANPTDGQVYSPGAPAPNYVYDATTGVWNVSSFPLTSVAFAGTPAVNNGAGSPGSSPQWARGDHVHPSLPLIGKNKLDNGMFIIWQRGSSFSAGSAYTADRWLLSVSNSTTTVTELTLSDTDRSQIGDEEAIFGYQAAVTGTAGAGDISVVTQYIERVRRLSNKTVTVSFYAKATSGTPKLGVSIDQRFGTGGSPSAQVNGTGQAVTLSNTWARYSLTFAIPSTSGKVIGNNSDDATQLNFWFTSGSTYATRAGNIGVQSATFQLWGMQLEVGSTMTDLEKLPWDMEIARCQRFYQTGSGQIVGCAAVANAYIGQWVSFNVLMRAIPTVTMSNTSSTNMSGGGYASGAQNYGFNPYYTGSATSTNCSATYTWTASADL